MEYLITSLTLLSILWGIAIYYFYSLSHYWTSRGLESATPLPFIGNFKDLVLLKKNAGVLFKSMYDKTKAPALGIFTFNRPSLLIRDPEWIKNILIKDFNYFSDRTIAVDETHDPIGTNNLFSIKNPDWKQMRTKLSPLFTSGKMKSMFHLVNEEGKELNAYLTRLMDSKDHVSNVRELCAKYTTDAIATCAYGIKANSLTNPDAEFRKIGRKIFGNSLVRVLEQTAFFFFPQIVKLLRLKFFAREGSEFVRNTFNETIRIREETGVKRQDLIDVLIELKNTKTEPGEIKFEGDTLVAQAAVFFTAGFETSSSTMSFTLYELALNQNIQDRLHSEINGMLEEFGSISYESINGMVYLDMVIAETLRKYPSLPFLDRTCSKDSKGYRLPKPYDHVVLEPGTSVYIPMLALHMDPMYFPDPEKYDPDRFTEEAKRNRNPYSYLPFGGGPRTCVGERFGLMQTKLGLVHILKDYAVYPCEETPATIEFTPKAILLTPKKDIKLRFEKLARG